MEQELILYNFLQLKFWQYSPIACDYLFLETMSQ
jgi:hypothetical protein